MQLCGIDVGEKNVGVCGDHTLYGDIIANFRMNKRVRFSRNALVYDLHPISSPIRYSDYYFLIKMYAVCRDSVYLSGDREVVRDNSLSNKYIRCTGPFRGSSQVGDCLKNVLWGHFMAGILLKLLSEFGDANILH